MREQDRCVRCGYCPDERLDQPLPRVLNSARRTFKRCDVCRAQTTHAIEIVEVAP